MTPRIELSPVPRSVARARRWVTRNASQVGGEAVDAAVVDTLALLVSEVVTNSVVHARTTFCLSLRRVEDRLRVEVTDGCDDLPVEQTPQDLAEGGRGVGLVATLSDAHGVHRGVDGGKTCWFEIGIVPARATDVTPRTSEMGQMAQ